MESLAREGSVYDMNKVLNYDVSRKANASQLYLILALIVTRSKAANDI